MNIDELLRDFNKLRAEFKALQTRDKPYIDKNTFTPTYFGSTVAGATTYAANGQVGRYTRVADICFYNIFLNWTAATGTGNIRVGGLPFTSAATTNLFLSASVWINSVTFASSAPQALLRPSTTQLELWTPATGAGAEIPIDGVGNMAITGFYFV